jgi:hypothetical protein
MSLLLLNLRKYISTEPPIKTFPTYEIIWMMADVRIAT